MKVTVKFYGTLSRYVANYNRAQGLAAIIPEDATVGDLILNLGIPESKIGPVSVDGQLAKASTRLREGVLVKVFQPVYGG